MINKQDIIGLIDKSIEVKQSLKGELLDSIVQTAEIIIKAFKNGNKFLICGNGGSAADSQHFSAELVGRFQKERDPLPAIALTVDTSLLTAWSNDYSFDTVFSRQVEALGKSNDILFAISTSGKSKNCIKALHSAKKKGLITISLLGNDGGSMKDFSDFFIIIPDDQTWAIQETHISVIHILCYLIEKNMGSDPIS